MPCIMRNGINYTGSNSGETSAANIIELTQEEYDALGEEKETNNTLYMIKDGIPSVLNNSILLWENPDPTVEFPAQEITLASNDYDILEVFYLYANNSNIINSCRLKKGSSGRLFTIASIGNTYYRGITYSSPLSYQSGNGYKSASGSSDTLDNSILIPLYIYGYKISGKYPSRNPNRFIKTMVVTLPANKKTIVLFNLDGSESCGGFTKDTITKISAMTVPNDEYPETLSMVLVVIRNNGDVAMLNGVDTPNSYTVNVRICLE